MKKKTNAGITLIALVITIIVLLILAGVSIATLTGEGGILGKANTAKEESLIASYEEQLKLIWQGVKLKNIDTNKTQEELLQEGKKEIEADTNFKGAIATINTEPLLLEVKVKEGYIFHIKENKVEYIRKEGEILKDIEVALTASEVKDKKVILTATAKQAAGRQIEYILYINGIEITRKTTYDTTFSYEHTTTFGEATAKVEVKYDEEEKTSQSEEIIIEDNTIASKEELQNFRNAVNEENKYQNKTVELVSDINLLGSESDQWIPIGNSTNKYTGEFHGNYHQIDGIYINNTKDEQGLFGLIENATITELVIGENSNITGNHSIGGVAGKGNNSTISNCGNNGLVSGKRDVGGIIGYATDVNIIGTYNKGEITGIGTDVVGRYGGICGIMDVSNQGFITYSYNSGKIEGDFSIGGIVGAGSDHAEITNCYNKGAIIGNSVMSSKDSNLGGITGRLRAYGKVIYCYNLGNVTNNSNGNRVGGVVGMSESYNGSTSEIERASQIEKSYNSGNISSKGKYVGGIVGNNYQYCQVKDCYISNLVKVQYNETDASSNIGEDANYLGKIVGKNDADASNVSNVGILTDMPTVYYVVNGFNDGESQYWSKSDINEPKLAWEEKIK